MNSRIPYVESLDADSSDVEHLAGGNTNAGVVRIGETVRRHRNQASDTTAKLLQHLEYGNFAESPRYLGIDVKGRDTLSYLPGTTGIPDDIWQSDKALSAAASMLRNFHNATRTFPASEDDQWLMPYPDSNRHEVICHNDFAPYNMVFNNGRPDGLIDFDLAGPGPAIRDVAYAVYWFAPLSFNSVNLHDYAEADLAHGSRRLKLFCKTYGVVANAELLDMTMEVLLHMADEQAMMKVLGPAVTKKLVDEGHTQHWRREACAFKQNRQRILSKL